MNKGIYFVLSLSNFILLVYFVGLNNAFRLVPFSAGVLINQFFLIKGVSGMLNSQKRSGLLVLKFLVLAGAFVYVFYALPKSLIFCVLSYIFQLIILGLSIKRENKKN